MVEHIPLELPENPRLAGNITHFARALRRAGLSIGPGRVIDAVRAVQIAGFTNKQDFYWTLHACFVNRPEHRVVYAQVFRLYWRDPQYLEHMMAAMLPAIRGVQEERSAQAAEKRAAEALLDGAEATVDQPEKEREDSEIEIDASFTISAEERLRSLDFEQMSTAEMAQAKRMLARIKLPVDPMVSRRTQSSQRGRLDAAKNLRAAMRKGGELHKVMYKTTPSSLAQSGCSLRHFGLNEPIFTRCTAFPTCRKQRKGCGVGQSACLYLWNASDEYNAAFASARCGCCIVCRWC